MTERQHSEQGRASHTEVIKRISEAKRLLLQCKSPSDIVRLGSEKWGVTERQACKYVGRARREIQKEFGRRDSISLTWHLKARQNLIDLAMETNDLSRALAAMQDIAKLQGLYIERMEHSTLDDTSIIFKVKAKPDDA